MNKMPPSGPMCFNNHGLDRSLQIELLRTMLRIRFFEETLVKFLNRGEIITPCHLYIGQEAVAAGVCAALKQDDYVFGTHRSHGYYLAKGGDVKKGLAEIFCKTTGCSSGRGGSMHLCAPEVGILGTSSIVAGSIAPAVGAALAEQIRGSGRISAVFHGDGVPEEGVWNESVNFAAVNRLPVLFICENNLYCTHQPLEARRVKDNIPELAQAHGVQSLSIDGNNVLEVYKTSREIVSAMRNSQGPRLIECRTYRWLGHVGCRDNLEVGLRSKKEVDAWKKRCPIKNYEEFLMHQKIMSTKERERIHCQIMQEMEEAAVFAAKSPYPDAYQVLENVIK